MLYELCGKENKHSDMQLKDMVVTLRSTALTTS